MSRSYNIDEQTIKDLLIHEKSPEGFPVYNSYYNTLIEYLLDHIDHFKTHLRSHYYLDESKASAVLNQKDPTLQHYKARFPEKQFQVTDHADNYYFLKPACCATAFKIWKAKRHRLKSKEIIHEVADCYRIQKTGEVRTLARNCYFTMPDFHMITTKQEVFKDYRKIRTLLNHFYERLIGIESFKRNFTETFRLTDAKYLEVIPENSTIEYLDCSKQAPYFKLKQEYTYMDKLQMGTIQIDDTYPELFDLPGDRVAIHFSMGSMARLLELLISSNSLPMFGMKVNIMQNSLKEFLKQVPTKGHVLLENKCKTLSESIKINSIAQQLFYPLYVIYGSQEKKSKTVTLLDRSNRTEHKIEIKDLDNYLGKYTFLKRRKIFFTSTFVKDL